MYCRTCFAIVGIAAISASIAFAQSSNDKKPSPPKPSAPAHAPAATPPEGKPQLPPGMTEADMQACMQAATPGPQHEHLTQAVGTWQGKNTMWMTPEAEPVKSECVSTVTAIMDGRFTKCEITGDMPEMGPFNGLGLYGFDNVSQKYQSTWIDNCGTGMMVGTGELSSDGKTLTWNYMYNCPIQKKPVAMREVERITGKDSKVMEMYGPDPKTGKEFKMMEIVFTRKPGGTAAAGAR